MELKVWVDGLQRVVCGLAERTTCQEVIYALAHATGKTGRFVLVEKWRTSERSLSPHDRPLDLLSKWGEYASDVQFVLRCLDDAGNSSMPPHQRPSSVVQQQSQRPKFIENQGNNQNRYRRMNNSLEESVASKAIAPFAGGRGDGTPANQNRLGAGVSKPYFIDTSNPLPESGTLVRPTSAILPISAVAPVQQPATGHQAAPIAQQQAAQLRTTMLSPTPLSQSCGNGIQRGTTFGDKHFQMAGSGSLTVLSQSAHDSLSSHAAPPSNTSTSFDSSAATIYLESRESSFGPSKQLDLSQASYCSSSISSTPSASNMHRSTTRPPPPSYDAFVMRKNREHQLLANRSHQPSPAPMFGQGSRRSATPVVVEQRSPNAASLTRDQLTKLIESQQAHLQVQRQAIHAYDIEIALRENSENDQPPVLDHMRRELQQLEVERAHVKQKVEELRRQDLDGQLASLRQTMAETLAETAKVNEQIRSMDAQLSVNDGKIRQLSNDLEREKNEILAMSTSSGSLLNDSLLSSNDAFEARMKNLDEMLREKRRQLDSGVASVQGQHSPVKNSGVKPIENILQPASVESSSGQRPAENASGVWV